MNDLTGGAGGVTVPVAPFARAELPCAQSDPAHFPDSVDVQIPHRPTVVVRGLELHNRPLARCDRADLHAALLAEPVVARRRAIGHYPAYADGWRQVDGWQTGADGESDCDCQHEAHPTFFRLNALMIGSWLGFGVGLFVVIGTLFSVVGPLVVPRSIDSRISRGVERALDAGFLQLSRL